MQAKYAVTWGAILEYDSCRIGRNCDNDFFVCVLPPADSAKFGDRTASHHNLTVWSIAPDSAMKGNSILVFWLVLHLI